MEKDLISQSRLVPQIMVSSTFTDLREHRAVLIDAINAQEMHPNVMEDDSSRLVDVIESSLQMVRDSAAYIAIIGMKYGQMPKCQERNPNKLSITELEFDEAQRLGRPILVFIMGENHPLKIRDFDKERLIRAKLNAFRERAKKISRDSLVHRVYSVFESLDEFRGKIGAPIAELRRHLDSPAPIIATGAFKAAETTDAIPTPKPPNLYAEPDYIGSHQFVGRDAELQVLSDWARPADPTNLLLYEAIGGNGKSMLTWEWATRYALELRTGVNAWAGRIWYSFYERGAVMADFCSRALAYMTGRPLETFAKRKTPALAKELLAHLHSKSWLLILDGLERILVAYHRVDAADIRDEDADSPTDKIASRNPCDTIRDEDSDLLRALAAASPSKILVSTRLTPHVLLNHAGQPINGVKRVTLPGLRPPDAEKLLRSCGITGDSDSIQNYLTANCDNHPLVIGVLGGLITHYLPARGSFDAWVTDVGGGAKLDFSALDLVQRRSHILHAALDVVPATSRQLLSTLALLPESVDYEVLAGFNPHIPPEPSYVKDPSETRRLLSSEEKRDAQEAYRALSDAGKLTADAVRHRSEARYEKLLRLRTKYLRDLAEWRAIAASTSARTALAKTVRDLETRGLLQFDGLTKRYDLHPVVRGVVLGVQHKDEREGGGKRLVDHFSSMAHSPYEEAEALWELSAGLNVVRILVRLGHFEQAADAYLGELVSAHIFNVEAYVDSLAILKPFFPNGWEEPLGELSDPKSSILATWAGISLHYCGEWNEALSAFNAALNRTSRKGAWFTFHNLLRNIARSLVSLNHLAKAIRVDGYALSLATVGETRKNIFESQFGLVPRLFP